MIRPARRLAVACMAAMIVSGCSSIPRSSEPEVVRTLAIASEAAPIAGPSADEPPDSIVRQFIRYSATNVGDRPDASYASARSFLAPDSSGKTWQPGPPTEVVILRPDYQLEFDPSSNAITLTGVQTGRLDPTRAYFPMSRNDFRLVLQMRKVSGIWRIDNPPSELVITQDEFARNYQRQTLFFLNRTGTALVPDPRYVLLGQSAPVRASRLVNLLLAGPSATLAGAVRSQASGAALRSTVTIDPQTGYVKVDLTGIQVSTPQARLQLAAQFAHTLAPVAEGVVILVDGTPLDPQVPYYTEQSTQSLNPDQVPGSGSLPLEPYYLDPSGRIISLADGKAMWGREGLSRSVIAASMSAANGTVAAISRDGAEMTLSIGRPLSYIPLSPVLQGPSLTTPTIDRSGSEVWVVQDGAGKPKVVRLTTTEPVGRQQIEAPELGALGPVTAFLLSPDGVRVAVVADRKLYLGVIVTADGAAGTPGVTRVTKLTQIAAGLSDVGPIAFASAGQLMVGARGSTGGLRVVHLVSVDGRQITGVTTQNITGDVTAIAVGSRTTYIAFENRVWMLQGNQQSGAWVSADPSRSVLTGSAPFVPR